MPNPFPILSGVVLGAIAAADCNGPLARARSQG
jgi:fructose-specific phosphotransferase system IIC component